MFNQTDVSESRMRIVLNFLSHASIPYVLVVSLIGVGGNFLTILMLARRSLSRNFNNCTLVALALTDLLFNLTLIRRCINDFIQLNGETLCRLLSFLSHLAELLSACFTAQFTAQRFIAVRFPLSVFVEKRVHLVHYFIVLLLVLVGVVYCFALVYNNVYDNCLEELELAWFVSDALFSFLIPFTLIIVLNLLIIFHLRKSFQADQLFRFRPRQQNGSVLSTVRTETYEMIPNAPIRPKVFQNDSRPKGKTLVTPRFSSAEVPKSNERGRSVDLWSQSSSSMSSRTRTQSYRVTRMLIFVSTCFLLLNAPAHISSIGMKMYTLNRATFPDNSYSISFNPNDTGIVHQEDPRIPSLDESVSYQKMQNLYLTTIITLHISYASYSINFFLYSFCGMKFRRELMRCMSNRN